LFEVVDGAEPMSASHVDDTVVDNSQFIDGAIFDVS